MNENEGKVVNLNQERQEPKPVGVVGNIAYKIKFHESAIEIEVKEDRGTFLACLHRSLKGVEAVIKFSQEKEYKNTFTLREKGDLQVTKKVLKNMLQNEGFEVYKALLNGIQQDNAESQNKDAVTPPQE